jgi:hypothetical protein
LAGGRPSGPVKSSANNRPGSPVPVVSSRACVGGANMKRPVTARRVIATNGTITDPATRRALGLAPYEFSCIMPRSCSWHFQTGSLITLRSIVSPETLSNLPSGTFSPAERGFFRRPVAVALRISQVALADTFKRACNRARMTLGEHHCSSL